MRGEIGAGARAGEAVVAALALQARRGGPSPTQTMRASGRTARIDIEGDGNVTSRFFSGARRPT
jgi:hypothetical protein